MLIKHTAVKDRPLWDKMAPRWYSPGGQINTSILNSDQEFYVQLRDWVAGDGPVPVDPADSLAGLRVLEAARRSAQNRTVEMMR